MVPERQNRNAHPPPTTSACSVVYLCAVIAQSILIPVSFRWMSILMFGIPAVVLGTMAVLYISNSRKGKGRTKDRSYMYAEDISKKS